MWDFEGFTLNGDFRWSDAIVEFYEQKITKELIEKLFDEIKIILLEKLGIESTELFYEEMKFSFKHGFFEKRKQEFLEKIKISTDGYCYWDVL